MLEIERNIKIAVLYEKRFYCRQFFAIYRISANFKLACGYLMICFVVIALATFLLVTKSLPHVFNHSCPKLIRLLAFLFRLLMHNVPFFLFVHMSQTHESSRLPASTIFLALQSPFGILPNEHSDDQRC